jgi:hypothetical protein
MRSTPRFTRGTSVIAALVLAAILGAVALGLHTIQSNSANTTALPAAVDSSQYVNQQFQAGGYNATASGAAKTQTAAQIKDACNQAVEQIPNGATESIGTVTNYPTADKNQIKDNCVDAKLISGQPNDKNPIHYSCIGKVVRVAINGTGLAVSSSPNNDPNSQAGTCQTYSCPSATNAQGCTLDNASYPGVGTTPAGATPGTGAPPTVTADAGLTPGVDIPSNCTATNGGATLTCSNPTPAQTDGVTASDLKNMGYTCTNTIADNSFTCNINDAPTPPEGPCQNGQVMGATGCGPAPQAPPNSVPPPTPPPNTSPNPAGGLGGLSSLFAGLARGLTSPCSSAQQNPYVGGNGTTYVPVTTINPYTGQSQISYVQQQTYNPSTGQPCAQSQPAPYGVGTNGAACSAPPSQPQCAAGATAQPLSASGNGCVTGYQCVPLNGSTLSGTPTPQISCSPQIADVNESVAISYSCQNATGSSGGGFSTNNQLSGSASSTISAPPAGSNTANFGLTCTNNGQIASAQCKVQINQPAIDLVANPQAVPSGQTSSIGWVTAGMQSCVISSPDDATFTTANASSTRVSGVATTDPITGPTNFTLTCQTLGGQTKSATTQVTVGSATSTAATGETVSVNSSVDGQSANHGSTVTVNWQSTSSPSGSALSLWLIDVGTEQATALIAGGQPVNGSYQWQIPAAGSSCDPNSIAPCASTLVAGHSYGIEAGLYTPSNAYLGGSPKPANAVSPSYSDSSYTPTPFSIGQ